jgi:spectinomycin phosphotransferase
MLKKPDLPDERIVACLERAYRLCIVEISFLPLGADRNAAVYRAVAQDEMPYFVKLRRGAFDELSVSLPRFLSDQGIGHVLAPWTTETGQLWASLDGFKLILYPFVAGRNGYEVPLSERVWVELGRTLNRVHAAVVPPGLARSMRRETYSTQWCQVARTFLARIEQEAYDDPVSAELAAFLKANCDAILDLAGRVERLADALRVRTLESVLCHGDMHAGNILMAAHSFYVIDWDDPILAPKERDLMFVGGGLMGVGRAPQEEEKLFYQGYGPTPIDPEALAYYRYERIVQDIALFCEQIFLTDGEGPDRAQSLRYLKSNFMPDGTIAIAYRSDKTQQPLLH